MNKRDTIKAEITRELVIMAQGNRTAHAEDKTGGAFFDSRIVRDVTVTCTYIPAIGADIWQIFDSNTGDVVAFDDLNDAAARIFDMTTPLDENDFSAQGFTYHKGGFWYRFFLTDEGEVGFGVWFRQGQEWVYVWAAGENRASAVSALTERHFDLPVLNAYEIIFDRYEPADDFRGVLTL